MSSQMVRGRVISPTPNPQCVHQASEGRRRWFSSSYARRAYEMGWRDGPDEKINPPVFKTRDEVRAYWAGVYDCEAHIDDTFIARHEHAYGPQLGYSGNDRRAR